MARFTASFPWPRLALGAGLALATISLSPGSAQAYEVTVSGIRYDVTTFTGSYDSNTSNFETPANSGVMPWWGDSSAATAFATAVGTNLGFPNFGAIGPFFGISYDPVSNGVVYSGYFNGGTYTSDFTANNPVVWAKATLVSASAPGPLPLLGAAAAFGYSRQLRKRIKSAPGALASSLPLA